MRCLGALLLCAALARAGGTLCIAGPGQEHAGGVAVDGEGNLFVAGGFGGTVDFDPGPENVLRSATGTAADGAAPPGQMDAFVVKYDAEGRFCWVVTVGGAGMDLVRALAADGHGGVLIAGNLSGKVDFDPADPPDDDDTVETRSGRDAFLAHYRADGSFAWVRAFGDEDYAPKNSRRAAVEWAEDARGVAVDKDGNVAITGVFSGLLDLDPGPGTDERASVDNSRDGFVVSLDAEGKYRWGLTLGGSDLDQCHAVAVGPDGSVVVAGGFGGTVDFAPGRKGGEAKADGQLDAFLLWLGPDGKFRRVATWGGYGMDQIADGTLVVDDSGGVYAAGSFTGKTDFAPGRRRKVLGVSDGGEDAFVVRFKPDGALDWALTLGAGGTDAAHGLCVDRAGNIVVTGRFQKRVDFAPGSAKRFLDADVTAGASHAFVASYDPRGKLRWARSLGAKQDGIYQLTRGSAVAVRPDGHFEVTGTFFGTLDLDPGRGKLMLPGAGGADIFVVHYDDRGEAVP